MWGKMGIRLRKMDLFGPIEKFLDNFEFINIQNYLETEVSVMSTLWHKN